MEVLVAVAASAWSFVSNGTNVPFLSNYWGPPAPYSRAEDVEALVQRLSAGAEVLFPGSQDYDYVTRRWSALAAPTSSFVVVVATEQDVAETVKFANSEQLPYLAVNSGRGAIITQGKMKHGIEIRLEKLDLIEISKDGSQVTIGGGALTKQVTDALWAAGKQTVTGVCECTGILGPGLGGGHGILQGRHGLVSDQFLSMTIVDADGNVSTISKDTHPDLWWAVQGAGHNFGIVTSVTSKAYDIRHKTWAYQSFIFTGDKVEDLYRAINVEILKNGTQPVDLINFSMFFNNPEIDATKPSIMFILLQEGAKFIDGIYRKPFEDLKPVTSESGVEDYTQIAALLGSSNSDLPCQKANLGNMRFPLDLDTYNIESQREVYELFAKVTKETPAFGSSLFLFEGFSTQGVKAIDSKSTAYPFRANNLLVSPVIAYLRGGPAMDKKAAEFGEAMRQILHRGSGREEMHAYVNYAYGDESFENWYGYEGWRQKKLRDVKAKYDPHGRFSFYAPIA